MNALRHHLRPLSWIALVAVLALALLPTLSHARTHALGQGAAHPQHCPLCALSLDLPMLPSAAPAALPLALASDAPPAAA